MALQCRLYLGQVFLFQAVSKHVDHQDVILSLLSLLCTIHSKQNSKRWFVLFEKFRFIENEIQFFRQKAERIAVEKLCELAIFSNAENEIQDKVFAEMIKRLLVCTWQEAKIAEAAINCEKYWEKFGLDTFLTGNFF